MKDRTRMLFLAGVFALAFIALIANVAYLAVTGVTLFTRANIAESPYATGRGMDVHPIYASRGTIYSSDNEILGESVTTYKMVAYLTHDRTYWSYDEDGNQVELPAYVTDAAEYASQLAPIIGLDEQELTDILDYTKYDDPEKYPTGIYQIYVGGKLTYAQKNRIEALNLPGIDFEEVTTRNYKYGTLAAHVLGYCNYAEDDVDQTKLIGASGIELSYNDYLSGVDGSETSYYDSHGYTLPDGITNKVNADEGDDVYLTINTSVQQEAELYMEKLIERDEINYVWAMVMEAHTGKILCMASAPTFDLNNLENITLNFNTDYAYECGSVVKPFVYATAMDNGEYPTGQTYRSGNYTVDGTKINDWYRPGWGDISYDEGLVRSSNVAICNLVDRFISEDHLRETYEKLGYWKSFDLDGIPVTSGVSNIDNSHVDYVMTGFGQSSTWTPYHLLRAYSTFANNGCIVEPYLVDYVLDGDTGEVVYKASTQKSEQIFTPETMNYIMSIMVNVINDGLKGTATQYAMDDVILAGKSGTGQIWVDGKGYDSGIYNYTIAALAPAENPEIVLICGVQGAESVHHGDFAEMVQTLVRTSLNAVHGYGEIVSNGSALEYTMMNFRNHTVDYSKNVLSYSGITPVVIGDGSSIVDQYPATGETITTTSRIFLKTDGTNIYLPNFTGWTRKEIATYASLAGLNITCDGTGTCLAQSYPSGYMVDENTAIIVSLS